MVADNQGRERGDIKIRKHWRKLALSLIFFFSKETDSFAVFAV